MIQQQVLNEVIVEKERERGASSQTQSVSIVENQPQWPFQVSQPLVAVSSQYLVGSFSFISTTELISPALLQSFLPSFLQ